MRSNWNLTALATGLALASWAWLPVPADAAIVLDQLNAGLASPSVLTPEPIRNTDYFGQSFTISHSGKLASISVPVFKSDIPDTDVQFILAPISGGTILFSQSSKITLSTAALSVQNFTSNAPPVANWLSLDYSAADISVNSGDQFGLVAYAPDIPFVDSCCQVGWYLSSATFGGNSLLDFAKLQNWHGTGFLPTDSAGIAVFVATVPEPATWALFILGFGIIGGSLRRQRDKMITCSVN